MARWAAAFAAAFSSSSSSWQHILGFKFMPVAFLQDFNLITFENPLNNTVFC